MGCRNHSPARATGGGMEGLQMGPHRELAGRKSIKELSQMRFRIWRVAGTDSTAFWARTSYVGDLPQTWKQGAGKSLPATALKGPKALRKPSLRQVGCYMPSIPRACYGERHRVNRRLSGSG